MKFFGKPKESSVESPNRSSKKSASWYQDRDFTMPCSRTEALSVFIGSGDINGKRQFGEAIDSYRESLNNGLQADMPPLVHGIYIQELSDNGFVIAAGNRVDTIWKFRLSLVGDNPVLGRFENIELNEKVALHNNHLVQDLINMVGILKRSVVAVGGRTGRWP